VNKLADASACPSYYHVLGEMFAEIRSVIFTALFEQQLREEVEMNVIIALKYVGDPESG